MKRFPIPPFTQESAAKKVQAAQDAWNSKDAVKVSHAYTPDCTWRNREDFIKGRSQIQDFLKDKWTKELKYKLKKELWSYTHNKIAVKFFYEWSDSTNQWYRSYGNELWEFDEDGYMKNREASINDIKIKESEKQL